MKLETLAIHAGYSPDPTTKAVAVPIYQTNTFVYNAGGYRFTDFMKVGIPLNIILWIVASVVIPWFWPLVPV